MRKVALFFAFGIFAFAALYPLLVRNDFDWIYVFTLTLILGIGTFMKFFFGITYRTLLGADQMGYIPTLVQTGTTVLNTVLAALLILSGGEIRLVMLVSALVFAIDPIFIHVYTRRRYKLIHTVTPDNSAIKQRWDAFAHQIANFIHSNTDIVLLTAFCNIKEVSVYTVYYMVIKSVKTIITSLMGTGIAAPLGDMLARNEHKNVKSSLRVYEFLANSLSVLFFSCTALLIIPFVAVFTKGITDVSYHRPLFAYLACTAEFFFIVRLPYQALVNAAGHYRQTRNGAFVEMGINLILSIVLVQRLGLIGVSIGTLCAMVFRTIQYAVYMSRNVVKRSLRELIWKFLLSLLSACVIVVIAQWLPPMREVTYASWVLHALPVFGVAVGITAMCAGLFYRKEVRMLFDIMRSVVYNKKTT